MTRLHTALAVVLAAALVLAIPVATQAADGESGSEGFSLLRVPKVQADLKMTEQQKVQVLALSMELRNPKELGKQLREILTPTQLQRLKQIRLQVEGPAAINSHETATALGLTREQRQKLKTIQQEVAERMRDIFRSMKDLTVDERRAKMPETLEKLQRFRTEATERALAVLTPEQRAKLDKMQGKKLNLDASPQRRP